MVSALFTVEPSLNTFASLLRHLRRRPNLWDAQSTNHTGEQTGLACFFGQRRQLHTLPCPYLYDISNADHLQGATLHKDCIAAGWSDCDRQAKYIEKRCIWQRVWPEVHAVHFKGSRKPNEGTSTCFGTRRGMLRRGARSKHHDERHETMHKTAEISGASHDLAWQNRSAGCVLVGTGESVFWADGKPVSERCCKHQSLLKAYWHSLGSELVIQNQTDVNASASNPPCCTSHAPEPSRAGRCSFLAAKGSCEWVRLKCPVACDVCRVCAEHPLHSFYASLARKSKGKRPKHTPQRRINASLARKGRGKRPKHTAQRRTIERRSPWAIPRSEP